MSAAPRTSQTTEAYVPRLVREWLVEDAPERLHRRIEGSMVFADVSGFTKMSERLSRLGKVGAEAVTGVISTCFTGLLAEAYSFGGTLLQFGGDALLLFFRGEHHERRAAAAALEMRRALRAMRTFSTEAGDVRLSITIGVQSGRFDFFLVGSSHRQLVVGGPTASELVRLESAAERGRILVGAATVAALRRENVGPQAGPGRLLRGRLDLPRQDGVEFLRVGTDLSAFIPVGLVRAIAAGSVQPEHRRATVAFVQYQGLDQSIRDEGAEAAAVRLDRLVRGVQHAIDDRGICFQSADVGDGGGKLYLSVGAPFGTGHDEEAMLLALREIVDTDLGFPVRAGTNSGPVFTSEIGTIHRRTFTTMGDTVNLAARLTSKAEIGQVLATAPVLDHSRTLFETDALPPFPVKGKRRPVTAMAVGPARGSRAEIAAAQLPIVGREEELARLAAAARSASAGRGRFVEIVAEPGAGKTRLLDHFEETTDGIAFHRVKCRLYQATTPYFPVRLLLRQALGLTGDDEQAAEQLRVLVAAVAPEVEPWLSLAATPLGFELPHRDQVAGLDDDARHRRLERSFLDLVSQALTDPVVLSFEDTQWMDDASRELLVALATAVGPRPWLLLVSGRDGAGASSDGERLVPDERIELQPLGLEAAIRLVGLATADVPLHRHVVDALAERSDGNPLYLLELIDAVQRGGLVESLPTSIGGLITARIDRLDTEDRSLLRRLSVLGNRFLPEYATAVLPAGQLAGADELTNRLRDFLVVEPSGWLSFRHQLAHEAAYEGLPYRLRQELHAAVADSMRDRLDDMTAEAPLLSLHYHRAGRHAEAWETAIQAGEQARRVYGNVDAAVFFRRALDSARHLDLTAGDEARVCEALGDVQDVAGLHEEARDAYLAGSRLLRDEPVAQARLTLKTAFVDERLGHLTRAVRSIRRAQRLLDGNGSPDAATVQGQLAVWYAALRLAQGRSAEAAEAVVEGIRLAVAAGDEPTLAQAYLVLDLADANLGRSEGMPNSRRALEIYVATGDLGGQAVAANMLGGYAFLEGRWQEATEHYAMACEARERTGDPGGLALAQVNRAEILVEQGDLDAAEALLTDAITVWQAAGDRWGVALAQRLGALGRARAGDHERAAELMKAAHAGFEEIGARAEAAQTAVFDAERLLLAGHYAEAAAQLAGLGRDSAGSAEDDLFLPAIHRLRGLARYPEDPAGARREVEVSLGLARERGALHEIGFALHALSLLRRWDGEGPDEAVDAEVKEIFARLAIRERGEPPAPR